MKRFYGAVVLAAILSSPFGANASTIPATAADQPIIPGEWHLGLSNALAVAKTTGIPIVGFWGNPGCSVCAEVIDQVINTPAFTAWRQERRLLMVTGEGKSGLAGSLYNWVKEAAEWDGNSDYPFIRIYWVQKDGQVLADTRFSGSLYRADAQTLIDKIESYISDFRYSGVARFAFTPGLEAEPGTVSIPLPLAREYGVSGELTNTLAFARTLVAGGETNWTEAIIWADGEIGKTVTVANEGHYVGGTVTLTLSAAGETDQTAVIALVAAQPATPSNPRFVGEPFAFGEWTMDLVAATNRVAATNAPAYTLVLFTGALWCPYCMGMEHDLLSTEAFKDFVRTNNIALVAIDNFRRDTSPPSLLRYAVYTGAANDTRNGNSGAGYLSRHGITVAEAEAVQARNLAVQAAWTLPGLARIGYPTLLLLRKDGTLAGRTSGSYRMTDNSVVPAIQSFDVGVNMLRLHELLALARDPLEAGEEANGHFTTTTDTLGAQDRADASLRAMDVKDVYVLQTAPGLRQTVTVSGPEDAVVQVAVLDAGGQAVQAQSGSLANGVSVTADITGTGAVYAAVTASGAAVLVSSSNATVRPYVVETRHGLVATEAAQTLEVAPFAELGTFDTSVATVSNAVYRFVAAGSLLAFPDGGFKALGGDLYRAAADGDAAIRLTEVSGGDALTWQVWNPGLVGFAPTEASVSETATNVLIVVRRTGGGSGACSAAISLDAANTTATAGDDFADVFGAGLLLTWADGEVGPKTVSLPLWDDGGYEGDEVVALTLAVTAGGAALDADRASYRLTIIENDLPVVGRLAFTEAGTFFSRLSPLTVVAREGGQVMLGVARVEGASLAVSAAVAATAGSVAPSALAWTNNDRVPVKVTAVTLPMLSDAPGGVVKVGLVTDGSIRTVPGKGSVTVRLVAEDAPGFAQETPSFAAQTRVAFDEAVPILQTAGGRLSVMKQSGALPAGISAQADQAAGALRLTGVPRQAGSYTAVYQVSEMRGAKRVAGGVAQVTITVRALESLNAAAAGSVTGAEGALVGNESGRVVGTLSVSVTRAGRVAAKYLSHAGTVTFSGQSWTACGADGTVTASLFRGDYGLTVQMTDSGEMSAEVTDPNHGAPLTARLTAPVWSVSNPATDYVGYYTVSLSPGATAGGLAPAGHSYMTVSLRSAAARTGKATYGGRLADGTPYSGSALLQPIDGATAQMVVFKWGRTYVLAAELAITANARETYRTNPSAISACGGSEPYWTCDSGYDETCFDVVFDVCGGYYNSADSLLDFYNLYSGAGPMELAATGAAPDSVAYGAATALPCLALAVSQSALRIPAATDNPTRARLSFTKNTGLFRGMFTIPFVNALDQTKALSASYAGVLLPGWTGDCGGCGDSEVELPEKPFGLGTYWFRDRVPVGVGSETRVLPFTQGYPMTIQKRVE